MFKELIPNVKGVVIVGEDSNLALDLGLDRSRLATAQLKRSPKMSLQFAKILHALGLVDVWRETYPTGRDYTHYSALHATYARIDHVFISKGGVPLIHRTHIRESAWSDHSMVCLVLSLPQGQMGPF